MTFPSRFSAWLVVSFLSLATAALGQDTSDGTLHVLRPMIHAEQDRAELCLEFDHPLDDSERVRSSIAIKLESGGKKIAVPQQGLNINAATLCLPSLEHKKNYRLSLSGLKGANNEKLTAPYQFSFSVPDRKASLAFLSDLYAGGMMRWQNNDPVLRGINVEHAKIELYRIDTLPLITEAWRQHKQTTLAPSESAYFARDKGKLVWQGEVTLSDNPNNPVEQKIALRDSAGPISPGFYLVVASAVVPKTVQSKNDLGPLAAAWLLRSELKANAVHDKDGYYAVTEHSDATSVFPNVRVLLDDGNQQTLAETRSDADGIAHIQMPADKIGNTKTLIALADSGDIDFTDLTQSEKTRALLPEINATIQTDRAVYAPGTTANITLKALDSLGQPLAFTDSRLQVLRPDRSLFTLLAVPKDKSGIAHLSVPVAVGNNSWILQWQESNGHNLIEAPLLISTSEDAARLDISADRTLLSRNGDINLNLTSSSSGKVAPYIVGQIAVTWISPDSLFSGWDGYHFGGLKTDKPAPPQNATFLTDAKGQAVVHLNLTVPFDGDTSLRAASITTQADPASGAIDPPPLVIPVKPSDMIIGIKPATENGHFAENSLARFDVVALDSDGKRRDTNNLSYQVMEEGRRFDWYQDTGRWNYKPLEQTRRIGGGTLNLKADTNNHIDWPVNAGTYQLVIRDAADKILAQLPFGAGWGAPPTEAAKTETLNLTASSNELHPGEETKIHFKLNQPAMVSLTIADDHIRKIVHLAEPVGDTVISFVPDATWRNRVAVSVQARSLEPDGTPVYRTGHISLSLQHGTTDGVAKSIPETSGEVLSALAVTGMEVPVLKMGDRIQFAAHLKNNTTLATTYRYGFTALPGLKLVDGSSGTISLSPNQSRDLIVTIDALQAGSKELRLDITGPHNLHLNPNWTFAVTPDDLDFDSTPPQQIVSKQSLTWSSKAKTTDKIHNLAGLALVAPQPIYDLPHILAERLQLHGFTTQEVADEMELLRLWHDVIVQTGLLPEQKLLTRQHNLMLRLVGRQKPDGGFAPLPGGDADISSTSAALSALSANEQPLAQVATEQAANWLRHHLDNSWFDEHERPERAAAYAALANAGRTDIANLHYFSDTSTGKALPPLAAAQLALAFAKNKDQDKAIFWLNAIPGVKQGADIAPQILPLLAENTFFDEHNLLAALHHVSDLKPNNLELATSFLRSLWFVENRSGTWRASVNGGEQNLRNILIVSLPDKAANFVIRNSNDHILYVTEATETHDGRSLAVNDASIIRHIYRMNGSEIMDNDSLQRGENYFVLAEGQWLAKGKNDSNDDDGLLIHDYSGPALTPVSCVLKNGLETNDSLSWIKTLPLTPSTVCEKTGASLDVLLTNPNDGSKTWHTAFLAKAERSGTFILNPLYTRELLSDTTSGTEREDSSRLMHRGIKAKIRIQ